MEAEEIGNRPLIAGHSHIAALGIPVISDNEKNSFHFTPCGRFAGLSGRALGRDANYLEELRRAAEGRCVFLFWTGNQHLAEFLIKPAVEFDFMIKNQPELALNDEVELIPEAVVRKLFDFQALSDALSSLSKVNGCRPVVCGTPPPKKDNAWLVNIMMQESWWPDLAAKRGLELTAENLSSPLLRYKLWLVLQSRFQEIAEDSGVEFAPISPLLQTADGYLRDEFWGKDATHAAGNYGNIMLDYLHAGYVEKMI